MKNQEEKKEKPYALITQQAHELSTYVYAKLTRTHV